jgi:hypothetical protein
MKLLQCRLICWELYLRHVKALEIGSSKRSGLELTSAYPRLPPISSPISGYNTELSFRGFWVQCLVRSQCANLFCPQIETFISIKDTILVMQRIPGPPSVVQSPCVPTWMNTAVSKLYHVSKMFWSSLSDHASISSCHQQMAALCFL